MSILTTIRTAAGGLLFLLSFQLMAGSENLPVKSVNMPVANVISQALTGMTPLFEGKRNPFMMQQVCALARGDVTQEQVNQVLKDNNVVVESLSDNRSALALLVNKDLLAQQMSCTAYLATSLFEPVSMENYLPKTPRGAEQKMAKAGAALPTIRAVTFDAVRFDADMEVRLAVAKATAQMYAVIAANLAGTPPLTWAQYQQRVAEIVADYAGEYLKSVAAFYTADSKSPLKSEAIQGNDFRVRNALGDMLEQHDGQSLLYSQGVKWLGEGRIFGKMDVVPVTLISGNPAEKLSHKNKANVSKNRRRE